MAHVHICDKCGKTIHYQKIPIVYMQCFSEYAINDEKHFCHECFRKFYDIFIQFLVKQV